jgi:hypothetical protein
MPWWISLYFILLAIITAFWFRDEIKDRGERVYVVAELAAILLLVMCGLAYWLPPVHGALGSASRWIFSGCISFLLLTMTRDFRNFTPDPELSRIAQLAALIGGSAIYVLIYGPLIYWGFVSAFWWQHNGA